MTNYKKNEKNKNFETEEKKKKISVFVRYKFKADSITKTVNDFSGLKRQTDRVKIFNGWNGWLKTKTQTSDRTEHFSQQKVSALEGWGITSTKMDLTKTPKLTKPGLKQ